MKVLRAKNISKTFTPFLKKPKKKKPKNEKTFGEQVAWTSTPARARDSDVFRGRSTTRGRRTLGDVHAARRPHPNPRTLSTGREISPPPLQGSI